MKDIKSRPEAGYFRFCPPILTNQWDEEERVSVNKMAKVCTLIRAYFSFIHLCNVKQVSFYEKAATTRCQVIPTRLGPRKTKLTENWDREAGNLLPGNMEARII